MKVNFLQVSTETNNAMNQFDTTTHLNTFYLTRSYSDVKLKTNGDFRNLSTEKNATECCNLFVHIYLMHLSSTCVFAELCFSTF